MTPGRRNALIIGGLLATAIVVVLAAWWLHNFERVERMVDLPRTGEARFNPLYALKVALEKDDVPVQARRRLQLFAGNDEEPAVPLGSRDTVIIYGDPRLLTPRELDRLLEWVEGGGHLVVRAPADSLGSPGEVDVPLFTALGLAPMEDDTAECADYRGAGAPAGGLRAPADEDMADTSGIDAPEAPEEDILFCSAQRFTLDGANPVHSWGDLQAGYVFARVAHGRGSVDVLADLEFMSSDELEGTAAGDLTRQLLAPNYRAGTIHLVYAAELPSLWITLFQRSWMAWLPMLLALFAWLWWRMQRFGPQLPAPTDERRSLLEHIVASGEHAYRYGYAHLLYGAVRDAFMSRLRRRDPQAAALTGEAQLMLLRARFPDVPATQIRDALLPPFAHDHASFRSRIATLIRLRNRL